MNATNGKQPVSKTLTGVLMGRSGWRWRYSFRDWFLRGGREGGGETRENERDWKGYGQAGSLSTPHFDNNN